MEAGFIGVIVLLGTALGALLVSTNRFNKKDRT